MHDRIAVDNCLISPARPRTMPVMGQLATRRSEGTEIALLERSAFADSARRGPRERRGRRRSVVLVSGEAGIGKSALVRRFCDERADGRACCGARATRCRRRGR